MNEAEADQFHKVCFVRTGTPGDAIAFERALRLCQKSRADLNVVGVVEVPPTGLLYPMEALGSSTDVSGNESAELDRLLDMARRLGIRATAEIRRGQTVLEVVRKVQQDGSDLLMKAAQPSTMFCQLLFGDTDQQLVRKCPCPIWLENPSGGASHQRILAAVDPAPFRDDLSFDPVREELNTTILQMANRIAQLEDAELHIVHVRQAYFELPLQSRAGLTEDAAAEVREAFRQKQEKALAALLAPFMRHIARVHSLKGIAADEISELAASEKIDVLVMGTTCRTGITSWILGNTAETVLNQIKCSLVALKPRGFVSPVR